MKLFSSLRHVLALAIGGLIAAGNPFFSVEAWAQTPAITLAPTINTVAGDGTAASSGDAGPATSSQVNSPYGIALDAAGNLYFSESVGSRIRKIDKAGIISTFAGTGTSCATPTAPCGDGGPATSANFNTPQGIAIDSAGNLYVADYADKRIRKIDNNGNISTIAGTGTACAPNTSPCGDGGQATSANLSGPTGVAVDAAGDIYIADRDASRIRKVNTSGIISTIAGTGTSCSTGTNPCGDGGPATSALLNLPVGLRVDAAGNVYIADSTTYRIRKISTNGTISTVAGSGVGCPLNAINPCGDGGPALSAMLGRPGDIEIDSAGNIYIADTFSRRVRKVDITSGIIANVAGLGGSAGYSGDGGPAVSAQMGNAFGIALDKAGNLYVAENRNRVRKVSQSLPDFGNIPLGVVSLRYNIYLTINQAVTITAFNFPPAEGGQTELSYFVDGCPLNTPLAAGTVCTIGTNFMPAYPGKRDAPLIVTTSSNGKFSFGLIATGVAPQVAITPGLLSPVIGNVAGGSLPYTTGIARDASGVMYITTYQNVVKKVDALGTITNFAGTGATCTNSTSSTSPCGDGGTAINATFIQPYNIALDAGGNVYISDTGAQRIRKVDVNGIITTVAGNGVSCSVSTAACGDGGLATSANLNYPNRIAVDRNGNLYIADATNNRVRKVDASGVITTVAGTGIASSTGTGLATAATLNQPNGVAVDISGNLYISEAGGKVVRKVDAATGIISPVAGAASGGTLFIPISGIPAGLANIAPSGMAVDAAGDVYIAESQFNRVTRVDGATGIIRPIAGSSLATGNAGDGGPATSATFNQPGSIALDSMGNLYISDFANNRIRQVSVNAAPLTFPDIAIGQNSVAQSVYVTDVGNGELNLAGLITSPDFFVDSSGTCGGALTLSVGNSCNLAIGFKPQQTGARTGTATVTDDALNIAGSTQVVQLSGNGLPVDTTIVLSLSTSNSIDASTPVKLTANVTPFSAGAVTTTGFISFFDNNIPLFSGSVAVSATGEASFTVPSFTVGSHSLTAAYGGDRNFNASVSDPVLLTVGATPIAIEVSSSDNPSNYGQTVIFTATVPSGATGTVTFSDGATQITGPVTISGTTASFATSALALGSHAITAKYSGDGTHAVATSGVLNQIVNPAQLTVTATSASRPYGEPNPTFSYTITGFVGSDTQAVVSGTPQITTTATAGSVVGSYPVTASLGTLAAGSYTFIFVPATLTVTKATPGTTNVTAVSLFCSPNPSVWGQMVTCTATLPANATGAVSFNEGAATLGTGAIVDEHASFSSTMLAVAAHTLAVTYAGDADYNGASSPAISQVVNKATLSVIASDQQRLYGQPNPPLTTITSGFVNGDTSAVATGAPVVTTTATATSPPAPYPITVGQGTLASANYNFVTINGTLFVAAAAGTVTLTSSSPSVPAGTPVTFTATVPAGATGTVQFFDGATVIGAATVSGGKATFTTSTLALGTHSITAVYGGDTNFTTASSTVLTQLITVPPAIADYNVSSNTPRQLIPPGASATYNILINSMTAPFTNVVTLTATGLPPGATYTFTPSTVTPGAAGATSSFAVTVPKQTAAASRMKGLAPIALAALLLPWIWFKRKTSRPPRLFLWLLLSFVALASVGGCGVGGYFSQTEQTYTITVTGTSGSLARSTTVTLTVE